METMKYIMIYRSPGPLKPFRIWAPVVFTLAENTAQSVSLGFDTRLLGNFSITVSVIVLLLKLVSFSSQKLSRWICSDLFLPYRVSLHLPLYFLPPCTGVSQAVDPPKTQPPWDLSGAGGQFAGVPVGLGAGGVGSAGEVSLARLWMKSCFCRARLGTSRVGWLCNSHQAAEIAVEQ